MKGKSFYAYFKHLQEIVEAEFETRNEPKAGKENKALAYFMNTS